MKYRHVRLYMGPFLLFKRLGLISNTTLGKFVMLYHRMTHGK